MADAAISGSIPARPTRRTFLAAAASLPAAAFLHPLSASACTLPSSLPAAPPQFSFASYRLPGGSGRTVSLWQDGSRRTQIAVTVGGDRLAALEERPLGPFFSSFENAPRAREAGDTGKGEYLVLALSRRGVLEVTGHDVRGLSEGRMRGLADSLAARARARQAPGQGLWVRLEPLALADGGHLPLLGEACGDPLVTAMLRQPGLLLEARAEALDAAFGEGVADGSVTPAVEAHGIRYAMKVYRYSGG